MLSQTVHITLKAEPINNKKYYLNDANTKSNKYITGGNS